MRAKRINCIPNRTESFAACSERAALRVSDPSGPSGRLQAGREEGYKTIQVEIKLYEVKGTEIERRGTRQWRREREWNSVGCRKRRSSFPVRTGERTRSRKTHLIYTDANPGM